MKNMAKINLLILIITLHQTSYCSEHDNSRLNSPIEDMFSDVLSQAPVEQIVSPFSLQHPDHITKSTSQEYEEFVVYIADNSTQTKATTIEEEIKDLIQYHCDAQDTNIFIVGEINGIHYEFSTLNNQRYVELQEQIVELQEQIRDESQKVSVSSGLRRLNPNEMLNTTNKLGKKLNTVTDVLMQQSERRKPSRRISHNSNKDTVKIAENTTTKKDNSTYFTTTNCLIASLTVASISTGYLMLKYKK